MTNIPTTFNQLNASSTIDAEIQELYSFNRILGEDIELPYSKNDVTINPNSLSYVAFNESIEKMYKNYLFLDSYTKLIINQLPYSNYGWLGSPASSVIWSASSVNPSTATVGQLSSLIDVRSKLNVFNNKLTLICANTGNILLYEFNTDTSNLELLFNLTGIRNGLNTPFKSISHIEVIDSSLFVLDTIDNAIHKFDISPIITNNTAISGLGILYLKTIGGETSISNQKLTNPVSLKTTYNGYLGLIDRDTTIKVKFFDKDLNTHLNFEKNKDFVDEIPIDCDYRDNSILILTKSGKIYKYSDSSFKLQEIIDVDYTLTTGEYFIKILFSTTDTDIIYYLTNKNVFKGFVSKLGSIIGPYTTFTGIVNELKSACTTILPSTGYDLLFLANNIGVEKNVVYYFKDLSSFRTLIYDSYKFNTIPLERIRIGSELLSDWVVNKSYNKLIYNLTLFGSNIHSSYIGTYNTYGNVVFTNTEVSTVYRVLSGVTYTNYMVGVNEPVSSPVINRINENIWTLQNEILEAIKTRTTNQYPLTSYVVGI